MDVDFWNAVITGSASLMTALALYKYRLLPNPMKWVKERRKQINEEREALYVWYHDKTEPLIAEYMQANDYWPGQSPLRTSHAKEHSAWQIEFQAILETESGHNTVKKLIANKWEFEREKIRHQALTLKKTLDGLPPKARQEYIQSIAYDEMLALRDLDMKIERAMRNETIGMDFDSSI